MVTKTSRILKKNLQLSAAGLFKCVTFLLPPGIKGLIMCQYAWICLINAEYEWIWRYPVDIGRKLNVQDVFWTSYANSIYVRCLLVSTWKNRVLNMPKFWMCLMQYIAWGHCTNYRAVIETDTFRTLSNFMMEYFARNNPWVQMPS